MYEKEMKELMAAFDFHYKNVEELALQECCKQPMPVLSTFGLLTYQQCIKILKRFPLSSHYSDVDSIFLLYGITQTVVLNFLRVGNVSMFPKTLNGTVKFCRVLSFINEHWTCMFQAISHTPDLTCDAHSGESTVILMQSLLEKLRNSQDQLKESIMPNAFHKCIAAGELTLQRAQRKNQGCLATGAKTLKNQDWEFDYKEFASDDGLHTPSPKMSFNFDASNDEWQVSCDDSDHSEFNMSLESAEALDAEFCLEESEDTDWSAISDLTSGSEFEQSTTLNKESAASCTDKVSRYLQSQCSSAKTESCNVTPVSSSNTRVFTSNSAMETAKFPLKELTVLNVNNSPKKNNVHTKPMLNYVKPLIPVNRPLFSGTENVPKKIRMQENDILTVDGKINAFTIMMKKAQTARK